MNTNKNLSSARPPEGTRAEPYKNQCERSSQVHAAHLGLAKQDLLVFPVRSPSADRGEYQEEEPGDLEPQDVRGSPNGVGGGGQPCTRGAQHFGALIRVHGMTGDLAQSGADGGAHAPVWLRFAQTMILRPLAHKNVPQQWYGPIVPFPFASNILKRGNSAQEALRPR